MAAASTNPPLKSSSSAAGVRSEKTIEEMYQMKTQLDHMLLRPDTYLGSVEKHKLTLWVYEDGAMVKRPVTYVPALYKIFDEILVNAADHKQRDPSMDSLQVDIDVKGCCISVYNNGHGIPVEIDQEEGVYVPEIFFGHLVVTSSNYYDKELKTIGSRNDYGGAKLTNIFSTEFVIETADGRQQKKYKQVFSENMGKKSEPEIKKCKQSENWTRVTFKPDLTKFYLTELDNDIVALMRRRVVDMAGTLGNTVKVELNGQKVAAKSFSEYVQLYIDSVSKEGVELPSIYHKVNDRWEVCVSLSEGQFQQVSFVNGIATISGGTHVDYVANQIASHLMGIVNKINKHANMKLHTVKGYLWVFVNALIDNPSFGSQTKETLTTRQGSFGSTCYLSEDFLKRVSNSGVVSNLLSWAESELKKTDGSKRTSVRLKQRQMADHILMEQWVHPSQPRSTQISSEKYGAEHGKTKKRDRDDGFAAVEKKMMEDPCSITKCITTIEKLQDLQVDDILVAADIFKTKENREVFLSFSRDDLRLAWIKREIVRSQPYNRN